MQMLKCSVNLIHVELFALTGFGFPYNIPESVNAVYLVCHIYMNSSMLLIITKTTYSE